MPKDLCFEKVGVSASAGADASQFMGELRFWAVSKAKMDSCCSPFAHYCLMRKAPQEQPVSR